MLTTPTSTSATNGRSPNPQLPESGTHTQPTPTAPLASTTPLDLQPNWQDFTYPTELPQRPSNAQGPASAPPPHRIPVFEYQWGDELIGRLLRLPAHSNFAGKFAIIADPTVDNAMRAQVFAVILRSRGVPISYVAAHSSVPRASLFSLVFYGQGKSFRIAHPERPPHTHARLPLQVREQVSWPVPHLCRRRHYASVRCAWPAHWRGALSPL